MMITGQEWSVHKNSDQVRSVHEHDGENAEQYLLRFQIKPLGSGQGTGEQCCGSGYVFFKEVGFFYPCPWIWMRIDLIFTSSNTIIDDGMCFECIQSQ